MPDELFRWGDTVRVDELAPPGLRPGQLGEVLGVSETGDGMTYTVEFGDGKDAQVPATLLTLIEAGDPAV
jgi:hypothetical protein